MGFRPWNDENAKEVTMKLKNYSLAVVAVLFFINGAYVAQLKLPQLPDTPAGNQAKGWLEPGYPAGTVPIGPRP